MSEARTAERPEKGLTRRGWTLLGAVIGLVLAGRLLGAVELAVLATGGAVLLLIAWVWVRYQRVDLVARRSVRPTRLRVGADGRVDLAIANLGHRATAQLAITDLFADGRRAARFLLPPLPSEETGRAAYRIPTARRGRYLVGPLTATASDPFGLARRTTVLIESSEITICPRIHDIVPPRQLGGQLVSTSESQQTRALVSEGGEEFLTLREYEMGDDLRRVHWRSTARTDDLMIRQDEARWRPRAVVLLDVRAGAHDAASFELAVEVAASVADRLLRTRRRVEVLTSAGRELGGRRTWGRALDLMEQLAMIETGGPDHLAPVLASFHGGRRTPLLIAVTGRLEAADVAALSALTPFGAVTVVTTAAATDAPAVPTGLRQPGSRQSGLLVVDAAGTPFTEAWNQAMTQWHRAGPPTSPRSRSPR